jgi:hypothetical protein
VRSVQPVGDGGGRLMEILGAKFEQVENAEIAQSITWPDL